MNTFIIYLIETINNFGVSKLWFICGHECGHPNWIIDLVFVLELSNQNAEILAIQFSLNKIILVNMPFAISIAFLLMLRKMVV